MTGTGINVDTMRRIDRWAGVPLCALATIMLKLWWRLRPNAPRPVCRVLFIELSEMGSTLLADPAMRKTRDRLGAELFFVIFTQNADSLALSATVPRSNVFTIRSSSLPLLIVDVCAFLLWTRRHAIDAAVDLELFSRFSALLTGLSGAQQRVGFYRFHNEGLYRGDMLTHRVIYNPHIHIAKNFIALVDALLTKTPTIPYTKTIIGDEQMTIALPTPSAAARAELLTRIQKLAPDFDTRRMRLVLVNPHAGEMLPQRRWMPERFAELIRSVLAANEDILVLVTGAPAERADAERLVTECGGDRCVSFAGHSAITDLPALYALAVVMVAGELGAGAFRGGKRPADRRSIRPGDAAPLSAARQFDTDLRRAGLLALRERQQSPQKCVRRQCLHARDQRRAGLQNRQRNPQRASPRRPARCFASWPRLRIAAAGDAPFRCRK